MKRTQHLWLIVLGTLACLVHVMGSLPKMPVYAQTTTDDGMFTVYTYIDYDGSHVYGGSYIERDIESFDNLIIYIVSQQASWDLSGGGGYYAHGVGDSFSSGPVPVGYTYTATITYMIQYWFWGSPEYYDHSYECADNGLCTGYDYPSGYASIYVPYPPATVTSISPSDWIAGQSYQGVQISGTNFGSTPTVTLDDPAIQITRQPYNTSTSNGISTTSIDIYVPSDTPSEPVTVTVIPGSNGNSFVSSGGGSLSGSSTANVIGAQQNACPSDIDASSGFSSILSIGGSGSIIVSLSHGSFNGLGITVPYGPYSTPESFASHVAALITKRYYNSGLTAQAFGANILFKARSSATLGNVSFTPSGSSSGSSFTADPSPKSCAPVNINLRLVPVMSVNENVPLTSNQILHNVWRLVTLDGKEPSSDYRVVEHIAIKRDGTEPDGKGEYRSPVDGLMQQVNKFDDGIGCTSSLRCDSNTYTQKFTITQTNLNYEGNSTPVMTRIPGQIDRLVMTINEHGIAAATMNDDKGSLPIYSPDPYPEQGHYKCYFCK